MESPSPRHILRSHSSPISCVFISDDNERIYSGDITGHVVITSTRTLRSIATWNAHTGGLLGVQEWDTRVITHGRDNKLHVWSRVDDTASFIDLGGSASVPGLPVPTLQYSMDVNALNYCRFSLFPFPAPQVDDSIYEHHRETVPDGALIALPNLVESSWADIWSLPSCERMHGAVGKPASVSTPTLFTPATERRNKTGIIMALHLFSVTSGSAMPSSASEKDRNELRLLCAYENGGVTLWRYATPEKQVSIEGIGWENVWTVKLHSDTIMSMAVSTDNTLALTVSADHLVGRYALNASHESQMTTQPNAVAYRTKHPGNAAIAIRDDAKVCAVGGWDGKIRLYSTRTLKALGTLRYHKSSCQALMFAHSQDTCVGKGGSSSDGEEEADEDEEMTTVEGEERGRWLVSGGKDNRVPVWALMSFENPGRSPSRGESWHVE